MDELLVSGVPFIVVVLGLVEFSKRLGLAGNWLIVESMAMGTTLGVALRLSIMFPQFGVWFQVGVFGLAVGLAACGIYDFSKKFMPNKSEG